ncbi:ricin-type beta-trefoil lectin domain protein [Planosporangium sp. 12N6]|uniref:ricin-type beta-trefoil lectin domain protein n=1 Tax=Planosporangium spinosum TaxID=3402278 RepID=UPI003CF5AFAE
MRYRSALVSAAVAALVVAAVGGVMLRGGVASATGVGALATTAGCGKAPTLTSGTHTIQSGGQNRSYILRVPDNYDNNHGYRLIFAFHWNGGTANDVDSGSTSGSAWSYYGIRSLANNSAIFVAPQGLGNGWANSGGQDLTFVDNMINQIEAGLCVDTTQLFAMGFSYGGGMSYAIACARATVFRAVAVYSGANLSGCNGGTQPIAYIGFHGLRDNVLPISLGRSLRDQFVRNNGCTPQNPPEPAQGSLTHIVTYYSGCRPGYPVAWGAFDGPHAPNAVDGSADPYAPGEKSWTRPVVWNFFAQFGSTPPPTPTPTPTGGPDQGRQIVGGQSNRCVTAPSQNAGTQVQLQDCARQPGQVWSYGSGRQLQGPGNLCLDASGAGTANGTLIVLWSCNGQPNQQWSLRG